MSILSQFYILLLCYTVYYSPQDPKSKTSFVFAVLVYGCLSSGHKITRLGRNDNHMDDIVCECRSVEWVQLQDLFINKINICQGCRFGFLVMFLHNFWLI